MSGLHTLCDVIAAVSSCGNRGVTFIQSNKSKFLSYKDLCEEAHLVLNNLNEKGIKPGNHVILQIKDEEAFLKVFWGCILGGIVPVPLSVGGQAFYKEKFISSWELLEVSYLVYDTNCLESLTDHCEKNNLDELKDDVLAHAYSIEDLLAGEKGQPLVVSPEEVAYIQFSSGSTGSPKGVVLTHDNLVNNIKDIASRSAVTSQDSMLSWMPLTHDMGLICFHLTGMLCGIDQFIMPTALFVRRPLMWMDKASEHKISLLYSPNFGYHYLLSALGDGSPVWDLSKVRLIYNGAEPISHQLIDDFLLRMRDFGIKPSVMYPGYGMAEACVAVTLAYQDKPYDTIWLGRKSLKIGSPVREVTSDDKKSIAFVSVGSPIDHCGVRICNDSDEVMSDDYIGHIQIKGKNTTQGYYNNEAANERLFSDDNWLRTGDLGFLRDNVLVVTGRAKNLIIINGQNYYPQDIENAALKIEELTTGNVVACGGKHDANAKEELLIFVLFRKPAQKFIDLAKEIETKVLESTGLLVDKVIPVRNIPKTSSGKVQNFLLYKQYHKGEFDEVIKEIQSLKKESLGNTEKDIQSILLSVFSAVGYEGIDVNDKISSYGLSSLVIMRIIHKLAEYGVYTASVKNFFLSSTIAELSASLQENQTSELNELEKAPVQESYPLSYAQKRFWLIDHYANRRDVCNVVSAFKLNGDINYDILNASINELVKRHEPLRTVFRTKDGEPEQVVKHDVESRLYHTSSEDQTNKELNVIFDLSEWPLFKFVLFKNELKEHVLYLCFHHIVVDGWSVSILIKELGDIYYGKVSGVESRLSHPKFSQKDLAYIQRSLVKHEESLSFWKEKFQTTSNPIDLPFAKERPPVLTFDGDSYLWKVPQETWNGIKALSNQSGVTPFMLVFSVLKVLLYKYTGNRDITVGTEASGRDYYGMQDLIGCYVNTIAIRSEVNEGTTFEAFLADMKKNLLDTFNHQQVPFDLVLKEIGSENSSSRSPLFDLFVLYQNFDLSFGESEDLFNSEYLPQKSKTALVDMQFEFLEVSDSLSLNLTYNTNLFEQEDVKRFVTHYSRLLSSLLETPLKALTDVSFTDGLELELIKKFSEPGDLSKREDTLVELLERSCNKNSDRLAIIDRSYNLSYSELNNRINHLCSLLISTYGIKHGDKVAIISHRSCESVIAILAILRCGGVFIPIDPDYPRQRVKTMLDDVKPTLILNKEGGQAFEGYKSTVIPSIDNEVQEVKTLAFNKPNIHDLAYLIYTSGSTGNPKGIMISHLAMVDYVLTFQKYFDIDVEDRVLHQSSLSFDTFVEEIFPALISGGTVVIAPDGGKNISGLLDVVESNNVNVLSSTPWVLNEINKHVKKLSLKKVISGGDVLRYSHVSNFLEEQIAVYNTYGPAETTVCATFHKVEGPSDVGLIGKPIENHQVYILDRNLNMQPIGVTGEVCIAGNGLANGYYNLPDQTLEKFIENPFGAGKLYKTGDLGQWSNDGSITFEGRADEQVKVNGYRIELKEIEQNIKKHDLINEVVATVRQFDGHNRVVAFYTSGEHLDSEQLSIFLIDYLPSYMIPALFIKLDKVPLTVNGKVDLKALSKIDLQAINRKVVVQPESPEENGLLTLFKSIFSQDDVGVTHNFFELGGDSLKATSLIANISAQFGVEVSLRNLFINPTVKKLACFIKESPFHSNRSITKAEKSEAYPLSHAQKRIWFLNQIDQNTGAYNLSWVFRLSGELDVAALESTWSTLIRRHESLRTIIVLNDDEPQQKVLPVNACSYKLNIYPTDENVDEQIKAIVDKPIALDSWPLFDQVLIKQNEQEYIFILKVHHIIADGWSINILANELSEKYNATVLGQEPPLVEKQLGYNDYVAWQFEEFSSSNLLKQKDFWLNQFKDEPPKLDIPTDFKRPAIQTYNGASLYFTLNSETKKQLAEYSEEQQSSLFMVLLAMVKLLLFRYSGQKDVVVGVPVAGRDHFQAKDIIGLFLNTVAVRSKIEKDESFNDLLSTIKESLLNALDNQQYPFDKLVEDLALTVDTSRSPLFDVMVGYQDVKVANQSLESLHSIKANRHLYDQGVSQFDLSIDFFDVEHGLECKIEYNTDLFTSDRISRLAEHINKIISEVIALNGQVKVNEITILDEVERKRINGFNKIAGNSDHYSLIDRFDQIVKGNPNEKAVVFNDHILSYEELNERVNALASIIKDEFDVQPGQPVGVLVNRGFDMVTTTLAIIKVGAVLVPMDVEAPVEKLNYIISDSNQVLIITNSEQLPEQLNYDGTFLNIKQFAYSAAIDIKFDPKDTDPAYIVYTSGSTGFSKGVLVNHGNLLSVVNAWGSDYNLEHEKTVHLQMANMAFDVFIGDICRAFLFGGTMVICPWEERLNPTAIYELIDKYKVTFFESTGALIFPFMDYLYEEELSVPSLKTIVIGSDVCLNTDFNLLKDRMGDLVRIINSYGTTETTIDSSYFEVEEHAFSSTGVTPIGKPMQGTNFHILNEYLEPVPIGVNGDLFIGGLGVATGYLNQPILTDSRFIEHPVLGRVYQTGDKARWQLNGNVEFLGRSDFQVKIRGHRVELGEIENVLINFHEDIKKVCVKPFRQDEQDYLCAYYESLNSVDHSELHQKARKRLSPYMQPAVYVHLEKIPITQNGKIDRKNLPSASLKADYGESEQIELTPLEEQLLDIWKEVLNNQSIGANDNFFECGGHSLKAFQIVIKCQKANLSVNHIDVFLNPTVRELALKISNESSNDVEKILTTEEQDHYLSTNSQKRLWLVDQSHGTDFNAYHMPAAFSVDGKLNVKALKEAFLLLFKCHESLRTSFIMIDGELRQKVTEVDGFFFEEIFNEEPFDDECIELFFNKPFDLEAGPLFRVNVCEQSSDKYLLLFNMHHIISDEWSVEVLVKQLSDFYNQILAEQTNPISLSEIQYRDYAVWLEDKYKTEESSEAESFWKNHISEITEVTELPADYNSTGVFIQDELNRKVDAKTSELITKYCKDSSLTPYVFFLSCITALIRKYTEQEQVVVGALLAGRDKAELEDQVGFYVNTFPLKISYNPKDTFKKCLNSMQTNLIDAMKFCTFPYDDLANRLEVDPSNLFNIMVNLKNTLEDGEGLNVMEGLNVESLKLPPRDAKTDLIFNFYEGLKGIHVNVEYNSARYKEETIQRYLTNLEVIFNEVVSNPHIPVGDLKSISEDEQQLLNSYSAQEHDSQLKEPFHVLFERSVNKYADSTAIVAGNIYLSYTSLNERANQLANYLINHYGVSTGDFVGLSVSRNESILIGILGILKSGASYVPIDPQYPAERCNYIIENSQLRLVVVDRETSKNAFKKVHNQIIDSPEVLSCIKENPQVKVSLSDSIYVIYTSGSTGKPKGVEVSHGAVINLVEWLCDSFYGQGLSNAMLTASINFDASVQQLFAPLITGGKLVISSTESKNEPRKFINDLLTNDINIVDITPAFLSVLLSYMRDERFEELKYVLVGGESVTVKLINEFYSKLKSGVSLINVYGTTEATVDSTYHILDSCEGNQGVVGKPIYNTEILILDKHQRLQPVGAYGEVYIGGVGVGKGYVQKAGLTKERFIKHPFDPEKRIYRTGDMGRWLASGNIELAGRNDRQVKIRGYRVDLGDIESNIKEYAGISEVVARLINVNDSQVLVAYVCGDLSEGTTELKDFMLNKVPGYMVPNHFVQLEKIPLTVNGKVDEKSLPLPNKSDQTENYRTTSNSKEIVFLDILKDELSLDSLPMDGNFFELGGHSLMAMKVVSRVQKEMELQLQVKHLFEEPVLDKLVEKIKSLSVSSTPAITPIEDQDYYALSNMQDQLWVTSQLNEQSHAYIISGTYRWVGTLHAEALQTAVRKVIEKHEILRTHFVQVNGTPKQKVISKELLSFNIPVHDMTHLDEQGVNSYIQELYHKPFDLLKWPLVDINFVKSSQQLIVFRLHHIIADGWSTGILMNELLQAYANEVEGSNSYKNESNLNYKDYSAWQKVELPKKKMQQAKHYWVSEFEELDEAFKLPVDFSNDTESCPEIWRQALSSDLGAMIKAFCGRNNLSPFMLFTATLNVLLYRYTAKRNVVIGAPIANRGNIGLEDQIGFYANTIGLKVNLSGEQSFKDLLERVKACILDASKYESYPYNLLIEDLGLQGKDVNDQLFNVLAVFEDKTGTNDLLTNATIEEYELGLEEGNKFDWQFTLEKTKTSFELRVDYNKSKVSGDSVDALGKDLIMILEESLKNENIKIEEIDLGDEEVSNNVKSGAIEESFDFDF